MTEQTQRAEAAAEARQRAEERGDAAEAAAQHETIEAIHEAAWRTGDTDTERAVRPLLGR